MASDRVIIVRISGIGDYSDTSQPLTLTSRPGLSYVPAKTLEGVVTDMSDQLSSDISMFAAIGSDPTTTFSVLAKSDTLLALMARGMTEVRNGTDGAVVRTTRYVEPNPLATIYCNDTTTLQVLDTVRIAGSSFVITSIPALDYFEAQYIFGSVPVPIGMTDLGGEAQGAVIYGMRYLGNDYQMGGIEQLPVTISTAPITATSQAEETVLFRGCVSKVSLNSSVGQPNQIQVECQSIMGMILNKPFKPTPTKMFFAFRGMGEGQLYDWLTPEWSQTQQILGSALQPTLQGSPWEYTGTAYSTRIGMFQARKEASGAMMTILEVVNFGGDLILETDPASGLSAFDQISNFTLAFNKGYYARNSGSMFIPVDTTNVGSVGNGYPVTWEDLANKFDEGWIGESAFVSQNVSSLIFDLIFGTFNADTTAAEGVREANMAAWLPFDWSTLQDIVDFGAMSSVFNATTLRQDFPITPVCNPITKAVADYVALPYKHADAKTVGDVLRNILSRIGAYMVYDRGRISFGKWIGNGAWPKQVNDTALATPAASLTYDRDNALQTVEIEALVPGQGLANTFVRPVNNADRVLTGGCKTMKVGTFMMPSSRYQQLETTSAFQTAVSLIQKYSMAAAVVDIAYRNEVVELDVGQEVYFSSQYVPNAIGSMGVINASGIVLKTSRAWETPTTSYTLFLPGYIFASNRPSVISVTGVVSSVTDDGSNTYVTIEQNAYTDPYPLAVPNAPTSDTAAFKQTYEQNNKNAFICALYDEYGTPYNVTSTFIDADVPSNVLTFEDLNFASAKTGGIILLYLDPAYLDIQVCWDAFQADAAGEIQGKKEYAYPWVR